MSNNTETRPVVVCLHSSGSSGSQWRALRQSLRGRCRLFTPDLIGYGSRPFRTGHRVRLDDEVENVLEQIGDMREPFDVVGHSYGGAVGIRLAQLYPERVQSLVLYEPTNFAMAFEEGLDTPGATELREVRAKLSNNMLTSIARWRSARHFINYWSGGWSRMTFKQRSRAAKLMPKVVAEYDALLSAHQQLVDVERLEMPVRLICGTKTTLAAKRMCQRMASKVDGARLVQLVGLGHMAPVTHPDFINPLLIDYVAPLEEATATTALRRAG